MKSRLGYTTLGSSLHGVNIVGMNGWLREGWYMTKKRTGGWSSGGRYGTSLCNVRQKRSERGRSFRNRGSIGEWTELLGAEMGLLRETELVGVVGIELT